ncbi:VP1 [Rotavirus I]|uniref:RNA-directed RNA polymerase n=1 Tax=Rotavirus I TaxID=1637496 RepID=A0A0E3M4U8_9REOV|nr:VP1 [Rotavirus I]AKA63273.1 VP1 [Rotavirus I]
MSEKEYLDWLSSSIFRNLLYTSLVYTNAKIGIVELNRDQKDFRSQETTVLSPIDAIQNIKDRITDDIALSLKNLLRIRYLTVYVEDKSDKRVLVGRQIDTILSQLKQRGASTDTINIHVDQISLEAKKLKVKESQKMRPYHTDQTVSNFFTMNQFEFVEGADPYKWRSDTLEGMIPHFNHRTHTLISSVIFAVMSRLEKYHREQLDVIYWLMLKVKQRFDDGYLELSRNRKWNISYGDLLTSKIKIYSAKIIHAALAMISIANSTDVIHYFLPQIIAVFEIVPSIAAKQLSSPMTMFIGICQLKSNIVVATTRPHECVATPRKNISRLSDDQRKQWEDERKDYPFASSLMFLEMVKNVDNVQISTFRRIFNSFSATFHVGHRIDNAQDAIEDQVSVKYTSEVDREMYDQYYHQLKNMFKIEISRYLEYMKKYNNDATAQSMSALANSSNGFSKEVTFIDRKINTTKKMLHMDDDLLKQDFSNVREIIERGIPMGTRNVPARQTRGIFILPWQVAVIQHTIAESMYSHAKKGDYGATFAEAYTAKASTLTYGVLAQATSNAEQFILYTDVSQWDASQHNTEPYRSAWINAIDEVRQEKNVDKKTEPVVLGMNVLDKMMDIQKALLNSNLILTSRGSQREDKRIRYHGVASGEKTTKIGNSFANVSLITTVLKKTIQKYPQIRVTHTRVDGDDNVVTMYYNDSMQLLQEEIKKNYELMNARVKALASYTGLEMAKRFIICGKIFERGAISIFTAERPYGTDRSDQAITGSLLYSASVNAYRGFGDEYLHFMQDVLIPPSASIRISGRLRLLLSPVTLFSTGPLSFEVTPAGLGGRMRLFTNSEEIMTLYKSLSEATMVSVEPEEINSYSKTDMFNNRMTIMTEAVKNNMKSEPQSVLKIIREKERQKTLGIPNVQTAKNRMQNEKTKKNLAIIESKLPIVKKFFPEELFMLIKSMCDINQPHCVEHIPIYMYSSSLIKKLHCQLGVRMHESPPLHKPVNILVKMVNAHSPIAISPSDIFNESKSFDLSTFSGKKKFLISLGIVGNELRYYLNSKLLMHDLALAKYDKLYETPGFGATQLTTVPFDLQSAERIFRLTLPMPAQYYEILMLLLTHEYIHYIANGGQRSTFIMRAYQQEELASKISLIMRMIDNLQLDKVNFKDDVY